MPSNARRRWEGKQAADLDEIAQAHAAVGGTARGRRYATQQINQAYAVLLASQFQEFCRDLHSECVDHLAAGIPPPLGPVVRTEFTWGRQLDRGNAQSASIGADFGRLGIHFWAEVRAVNPRNAERRALLDDLNVWRNAIVHRSFDPGKLGGTVTLRLTQVRRWRQACSRLARAFDDVMRRHLLTLTGTSPW
jgi:hypothetical protein